MSSTSMPIRPVTPSEAGDGNPVMPRLPFPFQPLSPVVDFVAGVNLSMYSKSLIGFLGGALLLLIMGAFSLLILTQMNNRVEDLSLAQEKMDLARQMKNDVTSQMHFRAMALLTGDDKNNEKIANAKSAFSQHLESFESVDPQSALVSFDVLLEASDRFNAASQKTLDLYESGETPEAMAFHLAEEHPISHELEAATKLMIEGTSLEWAEAHDAFHSNRSLLTIIVWSFSGLSIAAAIFLGIVMSWSYIRPIRLIGSALSRVAAGDFNQRVNVPNRDELGALGTDVNAMSQQLGTLYQELEDANRQIVSSEKLASIGQLSGGIAHDLRNPLNVISNATYILNQAVVADADFNSNKKIMHNIDVINEEVSRATRSIADLMDYAGTQILQRQPADLNALIQDCLSKLPGTDGIEIVQLLDPRLPMVDCDSDQIKRVFVNLAINACDAMPKGGRLTISTGTERGLAKIAFCDTGVGISDSDLGKIFTPLFTTKPDGTGFGLAASKEIIERHSGTVDVAQNNEADTGTIFTVNLPI